MQKVLTFYTQLDDMRAEADGWSWEDGMEAYNNIHKPVGLISSGRIPSFGLPKTPLHAIGAGWRLLAPPVKLTDDPYFKYKWWFIQ